MKTLLAILLSFIVSEAPVLAIHGGYTLGNSTNLIGEYAGVLIPTADTLLVTTVTDFGENSLGIFTLSIPGEGIGSGSVVIFSNGQTFTGTIQALPDPTSSGGVLGILNATFNYNLSETDTAGQFTTTAVTASAQGSFDANASSDTNSVSVLGVNLDGTSEVNVSQGFISGSNGTPIITEKITFAIDGFEQSQTPAAATTTTAAGG